jgi:hypothetical protein
MGVECVSEVSGDKSKSDVNVLTDRKVQRLMSQQGSMEAV